MKDEVLQKAMLEAVKVFEDAGYYISGSSIRKVGSTVDMNISAVEPKKD